MRILREFNIQLKYSEIILLKSVMIKIAFMSVSDVTVAEIEILSAAETKKLVREVYVFAEGVNTMLLEVRKKVRHLRELADHLDKVWRSCKTASTSIARGCMTVAGEVATAMTAGAALPFLIAGTALVPALIWAQEILNPLPTHR